MTIQKPFGGVAMAFAVAVLGLWSPASAQSVQQIEWCNGRAGTTNDQRIEGCTALINFGHLDPKAVARAFAARGLAYARKRDNESALKDFSQSMVFDAANPAPWAYQGDLYVNAGNIERAVKSFSEAITRAPKWMWPVNDRGEVYLETGRYDLALIDFDKGVQLEPKSAIVWANRCRVRAILGQTDLAIQDCNQALLLKPDFIDNMIKSGRVGILQDIGLANLKAGRFEAALTDYDTAYGSLPTSAEVLYGRGLAKSHSGDVEGGKADMAEAKAIRSDIAEVFVGFGVN